MIDDGFPSRCFIEREGGAAVVERLVTCGTPHAGSSWSTVEDTATALLGLAVNGLVALDPLGIVGSALGLLTQTVEHVDNALDQMRPGSPLLAELAAAGHPGVDYVLVRGTEGLAPGADAGIATRIVGKLTGAVLERLFGGQLNDLAVSVPSAAAVGAGWGGGAPTVIDAACNHMTFFSSDLGLAAVAAALRV